MFRDWDNHAAGARRRSLPSTTFYQHGPRASIEAIRLYEEIHAKRLLTATAKSRRLLFGKPFDSS
jgi:hypothetical protein